MASWADSISGANAGTWESAGTAAASGAMAGASFGPYGMIAGAALGIGLEIFGGKKSYDAAKDYNAAQVQQIQLEQQQESVRFQAAAIKKNRDDLENLRNTQKAAALGLAAGVNQGAQFGSGVAGGQAEVQDEGTFNALGLSQNWQFTSQNYNLTAQLNQAKIAQANAGLKMQQGNAFSSAGKDVLSALPAIGKLSSGWGSPNSSNT
jgi:hypothetical protein